MKKILLMVAVPLVMLLCIQFCLLHPQTRQIFTKMESIEEINYLGIEKDDTVFVTFTMEEGTPSDEVKIIFNSREIAVFNEKTVVVEVECDGVFEIKNGNTETVCVTAKCENSRSIKSVNYRFPKGLYTLCAICL